jgi:outer membrane immunogenic protein
VKRVLFGSLALLVSLSAPSYAADMALKPLAPAPGYKWSGCYGGGNIGYSWGRARTTTTTPPIVVNGVTLVPSLTYSNSNSLNGVIGGGQVGCNWQPNNGNWVYGLETDFQWSGEKGRFEANDPFTYIIPTNVIDGNTEIDPDTAISWFGTVRGRLGYVVNNWLLYATGGLAYGRVKFSGTVTETENVFSPFRGGLLATLTQTAAFGTASKVNLGWTVGGGIEAPLANNWTWKVEYLYMDLGKLNLSAATAFGTFTTSTHFTDNIVRLGLNYHFMTY